MKKCSKCGATKELVEFHKHSHYKDGHRTQCKECINKDSDKQLLHKYKITADELSKLREVKACEICGTTKPKGQWSKLHIDHCHTTERVRGMLCTNCNQGLGRFKDNIESLEKAIKYLKER